MRSAHEYSEGSQEEAVDNQIGSIFQSAQKMEDNSMLTPQLSALKSKRGCNCQKSRCIKLYCECYANGVYCSDCNCIDCLNNGKNENSRKHAIKTTLEKNPAAFQPKISNSAAEAKAIDNQMYARHSKGCACRKSHCLKKYCECFQAGIPCTDLCKCCECHNLSVYPQNGNRFDERMVGKYDLKAPYGQSTGIKANRFLYKVLLPPDEKLSEEVPVLQGEVQKKMQTIIESNLDDLISERNQEISSLCEGLGKRKSRRDSEVFSVNIPSIKNKSESFRPTLEKKSSDDLACGEDDFTITNPTIQENQAANKMPEISEFNVKMYLGVKEFVSILSSFGESLNSYQVVDNKGSEQDI